MHSHGPNGHLVQFYENDRFLIIGQALTGGHNSIVIATRAHLGLLEESLRQRGLVDDDAGFAGQNYIPLDANKMLPLFMADGLPDQRRFHDAIGSVIAAAEARTSDIYIFGELAAIPCGGAWCEVHTVGKHEAAIRVERYFNELQQRYPFTHLCAYRFSAFPREHDRARSGACPAPSRPSASRLPKG